MYCAPVIYLWICGTGCMLFTSKPYHDPECRRKWVQWMNEWMNGIFCYHIHKVTFKCPQEIYTFILHLDCVQPLHQMQRIARCGFYTSYFFFSSWCLSCMVPPPLSQAVYERYLEIKDTCVRKDHSLKQSWAWWLACKWILVLLLILCWELS